MRRESTATAIGLTTAFLAFAGNVVAAEAALKFEDCRLASETGRGAFSAHCAWYDVAENRDMPNGKHIRIHIAVVPALRKQGAPDPVFIVSGGPGQAASDFYLSSRAAFERLRRERDIVVVDQRGTGKSNRLDCELPDELETIRFDKQQLQKYERDCLTKLPGDPRYYTTSVAVRDLDEIRTVLGYRRINLYGISYGTRVVQHFMRRYPDTVRTAVLDGIVPVQTILGPEIAPAAQTSLDAILGRCASTPDCRTAFPTVASEFSKLHARLISDTIPITIADPRTASSDRIEFSAAHLGIAVRLMSYQDDTAALLPFLIHEASEGRPQAMAAQALMVSRRIGDQVANGMNNAVVCTEDVPFFTPQALADPAIPRSYLGRDFVEALRATCEVWPKGVIDSDFHAPLVSEIPVLLMSGQNDPVTPAQFGEQALKGFRRGKHIVFPGQGHGQINSLCGVSLMDRFIQSGSAENLNADCVSRVLPAPFMLDANTPGP